MSEYKGQKFFPGDTVTITDPRYRKHMEHKGEIIDAQFVWSSKDKVWRRMEYLVRCGCGLEFLLTGAFFSFVPDPYVPLSPERLRHFLTRLGLDPDSPSPHLASLVDILTEQQKDVINRRYGLTGLGNETLQAIANDYGITRERVRQVEQQGIEKIKRLLQRYADRAGATT